MADEIRNLIDDLPKELREGGNLPLVYHLASGEAPTAAPTYRVAKSAAYRAQAIHCEPYYKPISRCLWWSK